MPTKHHHGVKNLQQSSRSQLSNVDGMNIVEISFISPIVGGKLISHLY